MTAPAVIRASYYPSGLIIFGRAIPKGAKVLARGPEQKLRDFIGTHARLAKAAGRRGPPSLLVPGMPEADSSLAAAAALQSWTRWIATMAPKGIRVVRP